MIRWLPSLVRWLGFQCPFSSESFYLCVSPAAFLYLLLFIQVF